MDEAQAEQAPTLAKLTLTWIAQGTTLSGFKLDKTSSRPDYSVYKPVMRGRRTSATFTVLCHASGESVDGYSTEVAAVAACECHHAMGKWE